MGRVKRGIEGSFTFATERRASARTRDGDEIRRERESEKGEEWCKEDDASVPGGVRGTRCVGCGGGGASERLARVESARGCSGGALRLVSSRRVCIASRL